jgi:hypothetical protein
MNLQGEMVEGVEVDSGKPRIAPKLAFDQRTWRPNFQPRPIIPTYYIPEIYNGFVSLFGGLSFGAERPVRSNVKYWFKSFGGTGASLVQIFILKVL